MRQGATLVDLFSKKFILFLGSFPASSRGSGKHPQLMPSTPRWAVANGAGVILSVCDEEVARYETATLTAAAVPALLLPPPTTALDEHLVAGLPALEPYARLFHRLISEPDILFLPPPLSFPAEEHEGKKRN